MVGEILPFGIGQYFSIFGETISNSDLNTSHYLYIVVSDYALSWNVYRLPRDNYIHHTELFSVAAIQWGPGILTPFTFWQCFGSKCARTPSFYCHAAIHSIRLSVLPTVAQLLNSACTLISVPGSTLNINVELCILPGCLTA